MRLNIKYIQFAAALWMAVCASCIGNEEESKLPQSWHGLCLTELPQRWDEAIPLGNGMTGGLLWQKDGKLRLAIDRADLWDLRPVEAFDSPDYTYRFICDQVIHKKDMQPVYALIDDRTANDPAPTKIPAGALEFDIRKLGKVKKVDLDIATAVCTIRWENGAQARFFVPAEGNGGCFRFENLPDTLSPELSAPSYQRCTAAETERQPGVNDLSALGYQPGVITSPAPGKLLYRQRAWGDVSYEIGLQWKRPRAGVLEGGYYVTSKGTWYSGDADAAEHLKAGFDEALAVHQDWWKQYWKQSSVSLPDTLLERQWYLEMYKFGAASRRKAPPICLQAIWTADNGQTPPWRGDFHNDLNTQLSYWAGYTSNHLEESAAFTDWLWKIKENSEQFTRRFFQVEGLNVAGIATLTGRPIGGWSQYSHSPTTVGWLSYHFYQQWKYSMDSQFLKERAYPWVKEAAYFFENISEYDQQGKRKLPLSSSPEINDNRIDAWFTNTTNYDLANIRITYTVAKEMAEALGLTDAAAHYARQLDEWPEEAVDESGLLIAPGKPMDESHRHFSHLLAFHPFGLIDVSQGIKATNLILRSIKNIEDLGPDYWTGYTYAWLANMKARVADGNGALRNLHIFMKAFCSPNSFHLNGDQTGSGYSRYTYRPFTLEGNFACAAAIQEMLLQSHTGVIKVFPALPTSWKEASFRNLRAMGAFLVSASYVNGEVVSITVTSEKGGRMRLYNPFISEITEKMMTPGETFVLEN